MLTRIPLLAILSIGCSEPAPQPDASCATEREVCGFADRGWNVTCDAGTVVAYDLTVELLCEVDCTGTTTPVGESPPKDPVTLGVCVNACAQESLHIETQDEYAAFSWLSLCD